MRFGAVTQRYQGPRSFKKAMELYSTITLSPAPVVFSSKDPDPGDERVYSTLVEGGWALYLDEEGVKPRSYRHMCKRYAQFELVPPRDSAVEFPEEGKTAKQNEESFARFLALGATVYDMKHRKRRTGERSRKRVEGR